MDVKLKAAEVSETDGVPSTLRTHVLKELRGQILAGRYRPGERLNESRIARELNISRIPIREALSQLQEQGLVTSHERRGMFVTKLTDAEERQINSLRMVLEAEAMRLARARMTPKILQELTEVVERMENWEGPLIDAAALDRRFHAIIWATAGNPYLERTLHSLTTPLFAHKALEHVSNEIRRWRLNHHRALLNYVAHGEGDPLLAILEHLRMGYADPERYSSLALPSA